LDLLRALVRSKLPWVPAELGARLEFMEKVLAVTPEEVRAALSPPSDAEISVRAAKAAQPWGRR
jgi:hypothetical protein